MLSSSLNLDPSDERVLALEPVREWLRQRRYEAIQERRALEAQTALERALDRHCTLEGIVKLHDAATRAGHTLPIELERRYRLTLERLEEERHHAYQVRLAIMGAATVTLLIGVIGAIWSILRYRDVVEGVQQLDQFAAQGNFYAADQFIARLEKNCPAILQSNKVQAARTRLEEARAKANQRREEFEKTGLELERAIAEGNLAQQDVKLLTDLARDEKEKLIVRDIEKRAQEKWPEQEGKASDSWKQHRAALEERIRQPLYSLRWVGFVYDLDEMLLGRISTA